jgi:NitT/TauT family transport system permease protein
MGVSVAVSPARRLGRPRLRAFAGVAWGIASLAMVILVWQLVVVLTGLPEATLPAPLDVAREIVDEREAMVSNGWVTLREILLGFGIAVVVGLLLAVAMAFSTVAERLLSPLLIVSQAVPKVVVAPLFLVWFGFGLSMNAGIAAVTAVFPVIVNAILGLKGITTDYIRLGEIMGGSRWRLFWRIRLPLALPSMFAGFKLAITFATIGAVVGELVAGQAGLGYLAQFGAGQLDTVLSFAAVVVVSFLGIVLYYAVVGIERIVLAWQQPTD